MNTHRCHPESRVGGVLSLLALALLFHLFGCSTAKPGNVALMAELETGLRAVAAMEPDEKVRNPDNLAAEFLPPTYWVYGPMSKDFKTSKQYIHFYRIGAYYSVNARTKHIDAILQLLARRDLKQVVNIGAALDSRPYRLGEQMPGVRFFEIDRPPALAFKQARVKAVLGKIPSNVAFVPLDFHTQALDGALAKAGYDPASQTLFIMEGVTPYLDAAAMDLIMAFIAGHAAPASEVVFDYILDEVARGDYAQYPVARYGAVRRANAGEPWKFGIAEDQAADFASRHGLKLVSDYGPIELAQHYLIRSDGRLLGQPTMFVRVLHARVPAK